jgi:hypothetical protein
MGRRKKEEGRGKKGSILCRGAGERRGGGKKVQVASKE